MKKNKRADMMLDSFEDTPSLINHILSVIDETVGQELILSREVLESARASAVMFLLGQHPGQKRFEPCIVLNKRSKKVKQPGDLCCPGGSISLGMDSFFSHLLQLRMFPLGCWPYWSDWRSRRPKEARCLSLLFATGLRESFEEMRLNPLGVRFLGPLPSQRLDMFRRIIFPLAGWVSSQKRFFPNWEVEKVVYIPLRDLLNPGNYGRLQLNVQHFNDAGVNRLPEDFPCFHHKNSDESELLWGATYRIVMMFLQLVFGFTPPPVSSLPVFYGTLDENYLNGAG